MFPAKIVLVAFVLILCSITFETVAGQPTSNPVEESDSSVVALNRSKRGRDTYGCHKGYCWSYCRALDYLSFTDIPNNEWCYTTKTHSQSYQYVKCNSMGDCNPDWSCGGPCALI